MNKIQGAGLVFGISILLIVEVVAQRAFARSTQGHLDYADSLFEANKYTESFEVYDQILAEGEYTPGMLLKMAFIKEGLGDVSGALYFLNLYYNQTSNKKALNKLLEIAKENQLVGYEFNDTVFFTNVLSEYRLHVMITLTVISLLLFTFGVIGKKKSGRISFAVIFGQAFTLALLFLLVNFGKPPEKGIIVDSQTYLMTGPSGGADVIGIIEKGHRVDVIDNEGVWVKIRWQNQTVYIRDSKIRTLS